MTTACITTTTEITTTKTAAALLSDTLGHAWTAVRGGNDMSGEIETPALMMPLYGPRAGH